MLILDDELLCELRLLVEMLLDDDWLLCELGDELLVLILDDELEVSGSSPATATGSQRGPMG